MSEFKFSCPKCQAELTGNDSALADLVTCPHCQDVFSVKRPDAAASLAPVERSRLDQVRKESAALHREANLWLGAGGILLILGIIAAGMGLLVWTDQGAGIFRFGGSCIGLGIVLAINAHLMHLRASALFWEK